MDLHQVLDRQKPANCAIASNPFISPLKFPISIKTIFNI
ncbi:hypothetical protein NIES2104_47030 [Leptolyngbya sp. NIES-2104]|nr:hypothetical protein NIES2104_47030 [Leptolyngbya sp. NIES-2104]